MAHDSSSDSGDPRLDCAYVQETIDDGVLVYADLKRERSNVPQLVAVSGAAWAENPIKCELSDRQAVLTEVSHAPVLWYIFSMIMAATYPRESHSYDEPLKHTMMFQAPYEGLCRNLTFSVAGTRVVDYRTRRQSSGAGLLVQGWTDRHVVRTMDRRGARVRTTDTERLHSLRRDTAWCLADTTKSTRLPIIDGWTAKHLPWEPTGDLLQYHP